VTVEEWARYGVGEADADGIFPDYRVPPEVAASWSKSPTAQTSDEGAAIAATSWLDLVEHWPLVHADLSSKHGLLLDDPAVLALPWPGVRTLIFSLLDEPTRLRGALTTRR
jgi:hypothetical protein